VISGFPILFEGTNGRAFVGSPVAMTAAAKWNSAEFHYWYSQMPRDERKSQAWYDLSQDQQKLYREWLTFRDFARVAPLDIDPRTVQNCEPPQPDITCQISRQRHYFELGEVTDETVARRAGIAAKQGDDIFGGSVSQLSALWWVFGQKCSKKYVTSGCPLHLLLHYSVGHQFPNAVQLQEEVARRHQGIVNELQKSPFASLWLYDGWDNRVIAALQR
jgi:hypothetical protein